MRTIRYYLKTSFIIDDTNDDAAELLEQIRKDLSESISEYSDTWRPNIKIWEED